MHNSFFLNLSVFLVGFQVRIFCPEYLSVELCILCKISIDGFFPTVIIPSPDFPLIMDLLICTVFIAHIHCFMPYHNYFSRAFYLHYFPYPFIIMCFKFSDYYFHSDFEILNLLFIFLKIRF